MRFAEFPASDGTDIMVNLDLVSEVHPRVEGGSTIYFVGGSTRQIAVNLLVPYERVKTVIHEAEKGPFL